MTATATQRVKEKVVLGKGWDESQVKIVSRSPFFSKVEGSELLETKQYERFSCDIKNRPVSEDKINFFIKLFKQGKFFMHEFPLIVDKNFLILDGQHRYEAVKRLQLPLYFRFAKSLTIESVIDVQINAGWKTNDYLHAYIQQKNQNYIVLHRFIERYKITPTIAVMLLTGESRKGLAKSGFYDGTFIVRDETKAHELAKAINKIGSLALNLHRDASFCSAVIKILDHPEYEEKRMVDQLTKYVSLMKRQMTTEGYIRNLEDIYNYRLYTQNKVRFV